MRSRSWSFLRLEMQGLMASIAQYCRSMAVSSVRLHSDLCTCAVERHACRRGDDRVRRCQCALLDVRGRGP